MSNTEATAVIVNGTMPPFRIPIHGWNDSGVIAWTAQQVNDRTFEIIPWSRVESVTVTLGDWASLADYAGVVLDPIYPQADPATSCDYRWMLTTASNIPHICKLQRNHGGNHVCINCEAIQPQ